MTRVQFEAGVVSLLEALIIMGPCDACESTEGLLQLDPYIQEIHECLLIKSLCEKCRIESIQEI